jgi:tetratricopeptide (TPR) repeat protein
MTRPRVVKPASPLSACRRHSAVLLAACSLLGVAVPALSASANEIAQALARCQDEDKAAEVRARACTVLIGNKSIEDDIRAEAFLNRGAAQQEAGDTDAAIADFTDAIRLNPSYPAPYAHRADAYQEKGRLELALADLTTVIGLLPDDADSYADRGDIHALLGNRERAIADFTAALKRDTRNEQARDGLRALGLR